MASKLHHALLTVSNWWPTMCILLLGQAISLLAQLHLVDAMNVCEWKLELRNESMTILALYPQLKLWIVSRV